MFWGHICWQIGKMAFALQRDEHNDLSKLDQLFHLIVPLTVHKPSDSYSYLLKSFQKSNKTWSNYAAFVEWWGIENLMPADYQSETMPDGRKSMALAEQVAIAYARKLLEMPDNSARINAFMPFLDQLIQDHPMYQYPPYYKGKLLLAIGDKENVFSAFLPFARKKQGDFWIWDMLSETFPEDDMRRIACLCRALLCRAEPQFLGKVRVKLAEWLIANQQLPEAKTEIDAISSVYQAEGWKLIPEVFAWSKEAWYQSTEALSNNKALYQKYQDTAEEILFGDVPEETVVVDFVNREKDVLYFVGANGKHGGLKYGKRLRKVNIGDLISVRFSENSQTGMYKAYTITKAPVNTTSELRQPFEGMIWIKPDQGFGFVDQVFVEPALIKKFNITNGQIIDGICIPSWNKKQNTIALKAISISTPQS